MKKCLVLFVLCCSVYLCKGVPTSHFSVSAVVSFSADSSLTAGNATSAPSSHDSLLSTQQNDWNSLTVHQPHNPYPAKKKPTFMLTGKKKWVRYNPVNLTFGGLLFLYQAVISSQISADCPYEVSCSNFSKQCIIRYGLIKGCALSADRLTRCTRIAAKDINPLRISKEGMFIDKPEYYSTRKQHLP